MSANLPDNPVLVDESHWSWDKMKSLEAKKLQRKWNSAGGMENFILGQLGMDLSTFEQLKRELAGRSDKTAL